MSKINKYDLPVVFYKGRRFDGNIIDLELLDGFSQIRKLLLHLAKESWKKENPEKKRIPRGFGRDIVVGISDVVNGSVGIQLSIQTDSLLPKYDRHFDMSYRSITDTVDSVNVEEFENTDEYTLSVLSHIGEKLREDETIEFTSKIGKKESTYSSKTRSSIKRYMSKSVRVTHGQIVGEIRACSIDEKRFKIRLDNGNMVPGVFTDEQESTVLTALVKHDYLRLNINGTIQYGKNDEPEKIVDVTSLAINKSSLIESSESFWETATLDDISDVQTVTVIQSIEELSGVWPGEIDDGFEEEIQSLRETSLLQT